MIHGSASYPNEVCEFNIMVWVAKDILAWAEYDL